LLLRGKKSLACVRLCARVLSCVRMCVCVCLCVRLKSERVDWQFADCSLACYYFIGLLPLQNHAFTTILPDGSARARVRLLINSAKINDHITRIFTSFLSEHSHARTHALLDNHTHRQAHTHMRTHKRTRRRAHGPKTLPRNSSRGFQFCFFPLSRYMLIQLPPPLVIYLKK
jgi:hypothetical protein